MLFLSLFSQTVTLEIACCNQVFCEPDNGIAAESISS